MDFSADYPRYPKIQSVTIAEDDMDFYMTLKPCTYPLSCGTTLLTIAA